MSAKFEWHYHRRGEESSLKMHWTLKAFGNPLVVAIIENEFLIQDLDPVERMQDELMSLYLFCGGTLRIATTPRTAINLPPPFAGNYLHLHRNSASDSP